MNSNHMANHQSEAFTLGDVCSACTSLRLHWPEYLMEARELAVYMFLACAFARLLQHPALPIRHKIVGAISRRAIMGIAIGATVVAIVLTPWGKQLGGHFNPAITLTFFRLGKLKLWDALFYAAAQFSGALSGVVVATYVLRGAPGNDAIRYAVTVPGLYGAAVTFVAELMISFSLIITSYSSRIGSAGHDTRLMSSGHSMRSSSLLRLHCRE